MSAKLRSVLLLLLLTLLPVGCDRGVGSLFAPPCENTVERADRDTDEDLLRCLGSGLR